MKKIAIFGSTGSIGSSLLKIIKADQKNFKIELLTANKNYKKLIKQVKLFNVKNVIVTDYNSFLITTKLLKDTKVKVFNNFDSLNKIFNTNNKIDYSMCAISGFKGLKPTLDIIKFTKTIAIANKESIICGWNLIKKDLKKNKTYFIPVDSEHFSIWSLLDNNKKNNFEKIYITASGGPFRKLPLKKFKNISVKDALKHPNWSMGKKISIDSATMMNKVFEIIGNNTQLRDKLEENTKYFKSKIINTNRTVGAMLSGVVAKKYGGYVQKLVKKDVSMSGKQLL